MSAGLLDVNVLIALAWPQHVHHAAAHDWFAAKGRGPWATCALTQLAFVRISSNPGIIAQAVSPRVAHAVLQDITRVSGHEYWAELPEPGAIESLQSAQLVGHRQVMDAYLVDLARHRSGAIVTFDKALTVLASRAGGTAVLLKS